MSDDVEKPEANKEFFDAIIKKVDPKILQDVIDSEGVYKQTVIALLVELNASLALLCQIMYSAVKGEGDDKVIYCPRCQENVAPNQMGYCPKCKLDLVKQLKADSIHLGKRVS